MLKETKIDSHAVDIVDFAQVAGIDDLLDLPYGPRIDECVVDHQNAVGRFGGLMIDSASRIDAAKGFSTSTCFPA